MSAEISRVRVVDIPSTDAPLAVPLHAELSEVLADVRESLCNWLEGPASAGIELAPSDHLLVRPPAGDAPGVVLGRIGCYRAPPPAPERHVAPDGPMVSVDFDSLAIDAARARGALMFRLAESVSGIVVHESVRKAVEAAGIDSLSFTVPADWAG